MIDISLICMHSSILVINVVYAFFTVKFFSSLDVREQKMESSQDLMEWQLMMKETSLLQIQETTGSRYFFKFINF